MPISGSENVRKYLFEEIEKDLGGHWAIESDPVKAAEMISKHIENKRDELVINEEKERKLFDMADRRELSID